MKKPSLKFWVPVAFFVILSIHSIRLLSTLTPVALSEQWPLTERAHFIDAAESYRMGKMLDNSKQVRGVDFQNYAGYHTGDVLKSDRRAIVLISSFVRKIISPGRFIKISIYGLYFLIPIFLFWSVWLFARDKKIALVAMALSVAGFSTYEAFSWKLIHLGDHSFIFSSNLSVLVVALFYRLTQKPSMASLFLFTLFSLVLGFFHSKFLVLAFIPIGVCFYQSRNKIHVEDKIYIFMSLCFLFYITTRFFGIYYEIHKYSEIWFKDTFRSSIFDLVRLYWPVTDRSSLPNSLIRLFLLIAMFEGLVLLKKNQKSLGALLAVWLGLLFVISFVGSSLPIVKEWGPRRYLLFFTVLQIIPASYFLSSIFLKPKTIRMWLFLGIAWFQLTYPMAGYDPNYIITSDHAEDYDRVESFLESIKPEGRLLFEEHNDSYIISQMLQAKTDFSLVGPANRLVSPELADPDFSTARGLAPRTFFGKAYEDYDEESLVDLLDKLHVSHVVTFSVQGDHLFNQFPKRFTPLIEDSFVAVDLKKTQAKLEANGHPGGFQVPPQWKLFQVFYVKSFKDDYFVQGKGTVETEPNQLIINNPSQGQLVLKFRYLEDLISFPSVDLTSTTVSGINFPLLTVDNNKGFDRFEIRAKGRFD